VEIAADDQGWLERVDAVPGSGDRMVVEVGDVEYLTFAGVPMARFDLQVLGRLPRDWGNRWTMTHVKHVLG